VKVARILTIAGSDSSGGAGIQADIKTVMAMGGYGMTAVTAVTAQDTKGVHALHPVPADIVRAQILACLNDIGADAIKIGMLASVQNAMVVADTLREHAAGIPIVLDPLLVSTSGTSLLEEGGTAVLRGQLFPLATLVTPNLSEAEAFADFECGKPEDILRAGHALMALGAKAVLIKGGHGGGDTLIDTLVMPEGVEYFEAGRVETLHTHGTGCTFATAIAVGLAQRRTLTESVARAHALVQAAIAAAPGLGSGHGPLGHLLAAP
jgi:hydroxymethylpyrimidine/phosphomethylpyrimidine kinase